MISAVAGAPCRPAQTAQTGPLVQTACCSYNLTLISLTGSTIPRPKSCCKYCESRSTTQRIKWPLPQGQVSRPSELQAGSHEPRNGHAAFFLAFIMPYCTDRTLGGLVGLGTAAPALLPLPPALHAKVTALPIPLQFPLRPAPPLARRQRRGACAPASQFHGRSCTKCAGPAAGRHGRRLGSGTALDQQLLSAVRRLPPALTHPRPR